MWQNALRMNLWNSYDPFTVAPCSSWQDSAQYECEGMTMDTSGERRASDRLSLDNFQRVREAESGELLGYMGDISPLGLKLLGKRPITIGARFRLRLNYICTGGDKAVANLEAEAMWCHQEDNMPYLEVGFRFTDVNAETRACIERIMNDLNARTAVGG